MFPNTNRELGFHRFAGERFEVLGRPLTAEGLGQAGKGPHVYR